MGGAAEIGELPRSPSPLDSFPQCARVVNLGMAYQFRHAICNEVFENWDFTESCKSIRAAGYAGIEIGSPGPDWQGGRS
jgi:hypothetical protein